MIKLIFPNIVYTNDKSICQNGIQFIFFDNNLVLQEKVNTYYSSSAIFFSEIEKITSKVFVFHLIKDSYIVINDKYDFKFILNKHQWNNYLFSINIKDKSILPFLSKCIYSIINSTIEITQINDYLNNCYLKISDART